MIGQGFRGPGADIGDRPETFAMAQALENCSKNPIDPEDGTAIMTTDHAQPPRAREQFRQHLATVLADLQETAAQDGEAVALIGSLATQLSDKFRQASWSRAKDAMSADNYDELLQSFEKQGNALHQAGRTKQAYAVQALATSLVAGTQRADTVIAQGEGLLDALIDRSVALYRQHLAKRH
ncbi:hypothetical protein O9Z70_09720 [Devosia sp. YIM 151766]|uniref:hypothetical protein n=1 Tax=Devosia sp. YIM 151766 TaxID=3017325 RepID=UPI00255C7C8A|nr:hypothetical protein [Devosia sp. YIM 151766]WIY51765.1 hypothetical protein O9Z70_09720 [Devosia sp. YIM 151766]